MLFFLGGARPLGSACLWVHLLLWTLETPLVSSQGEPCLSWTSGMVDLEGSFQCPPSPELGDLKFCCGTCRNPYCCSSEEDRLDQTLCSTHHQDEPTTNAPKVEVPPSQPDLLPFWARLLLTLILFLVLLPLLCCLLHTVCNCQSWQIQNRNEQDHRPTRRDDPTIQLSSESEHPPSDGEHSQHKSADDPQDPKVSCPTSNVPPGAESGHVNAGYQDDEAQPCPNPTSEPGVAVGDPSPSRACVPSSVPSCADIKASHGIKPKTPALVQRGSAEDPQDPKVSCPTSNVPLGAESGHVNAGYQDDDEAQPCPNPTSEPGVAVGDPSPSQACVPSSVPSCADIKESHGIKRKRPSLVRHGSARNNHSKDSQGTRLQRSASVRFCLPSSNDEVSNLYIDRSQQFTSFVSQAPTSALATPPGNPQVQVVDLRDPPPRPPPPPEDPKPNSVSASQNIQCAPHASDSPPMEQTQHATPGAIEVITISPPDLPGATATGPILETLPKAD